MLTFELDLGIVMFYEKGDERYPLLDHRLHFQSLCLAKPYFWLSTKSPLAHQKSITFEEVITYPLIYKEAVDKNILWHILQCNGVTRAELIESDNVYLIAQLIEDDQGICFDMKNQFGMLGFANIFFQKGIKAIPLSPKEQYNLNIGVAIHQDKLNDVGIQNIITVLKNNVG